MSGYVSLANGTKVPIHDGFVLGRVAGCDLVIDDGKASRRHARFLVESGVVEIEDMQSSNGTLLNDKPVARRVLRDGDRVQIGKTVIVFHEGELPNARPAPAGAAAPARRPAAVLDDNDLFADAGATSISAPAPAPAPSPRSPEPAPPPVAARSPEFAPPPTPRPAPAAATPPAPPRPPAPAAPTPPAPPRPSVVEFADEVVEIRKPAKAAPAAAAAPTGPATVSALASRVLQFHKQAAGSGGLLGDDMSQMGGGMRALLWLAVLAGAAGVVWLVTTLTA